MDIIEFIEGINEYLSQFLLFRAFKFFLAFYLIVIFIVIIGILYRIGRQYWIILMSGQEFPKYHKGAWQTEWEDNVLTHLEHDEPNQWKVAVIQAFEMLNRALTRAQYPGENVGQRLDSLLPSQLPNLEEIKEANKVKNNIVQDESFHVGQEEARQIVDLIRSALKFFEVIDYEK